MLTRCRKTFSPCRRLGNVKPSLRFQWQARVQSHQSFLRKLNSLSILAKHRRPQNNTTKKSSTPTDDGFPTAKQKESPSPSTWYVLCWVCCVSCSSSVLPKETISPRGIRAQSQSLNRISFWHMIEYSQYYFQMRKRKITIFESDLWSAIVMVSSPSSWHTFQNSKP